MRLAVKVIGLAVTVATIILIAFLGSMIYSLYTTFATGEPCTSAMWTTSSQTGR